MRPTLTLLLARIYSETHRTVPPDLLRALQPNPDRK